MNPGKKFGRLSTDERLPVGLAGTASLAVLGGGRCPAQQRKREEGEQERDERGRGGHGLEAVGERGSGGMEQFARGGLRELCTRARRIRERAGGGVLLGGCEGSRKRVVEVVLVDGKAETAEERDAECAAEFGAGFGDGRRGKQAADEYVGSGDTAGEKRREHRSGDQTASRRQQPGCRGQRRLAADQ